ncbi:hypothetical protein SACE_0156 [Saccharopolyspora erythraea NRRL 2338]|uniref:Tat pathway signal protein n=1 Tax=Saccharopolyspora erythraea (strain ATCC 11635 / DSM 40517 / JCM 4748 / NBRC 13426 / NCIMB 8594 / NRRL 2338) TaxID=405948 RepID=A4F634_SACEN|nr:hypothetical protein N599_00780 [Saccharopolyspora erythraea D]QRK93174.1 hypothetical protein JQX30_00765 [Saccharopolyspora erythraea]CAL99508.1 hypothetical protein SACE_0156 [Saccharopolyspora erythraea NRRL 2338]
MADDDKPQGQEPTTPGDGEQRRGQMRYQDPESTAPREPTLAEQRARIAAEKRREEKQAAELAEAERKTRTRRRVMIGGGATVGVVALVAAFYQGAAYSQEQAAVTQYCAAVPQNGQVTADQDDFCDENYVNSHHGYVNHGTGMFFMPIFLPGGGIGGYNQYRYGYTAPGAPAPAVGSTVSSPNFTKPSGSTIKDSKGSTVQRGGFGINNKSGSGS